MSVHDANKSLIAELRSAFSSCDANRVKRAIMNTFSPDARIKLQYPFQEVSGPSELWDRVYAPMYDAIPDLQRRDFIEVAGQRWGHDATENWIGLGGDFLGTFSAPLFGIPPTGGPVFMRYHEYMRIDDGRVIEMQGLWDMPQIILQAGVWPLPLHRGVELPCPWPSDGEGIIDAPHDLEAASESIQLVWSMLHELQNGTETNPEIGLAGFWHEDALWYGPTGVGSARGHRAIANDIFRQFRSGFSDNTRHLENGVFFADHNIVAFTGWPSGTAVHSGDGFLGLAPSGKTITRCSLDFWRLENGQIRECWVMIDVIDIYRQIGIDVYNLLLAKGMTEHVV